MSARGITPYPMQAAVLDALTAAMTGLLDGSLLKLTKANLALLPTITLAACDAAEADFPGYGSKEVTSWQAAARDDSGYIRVDGDLKQWLANATTSSNTVYNVYMTNADEDVLQQVWTLPTPVIMGVNLLQAIDFFPSFYFPPG